MNKQEATKQLANLVRNIDAAFEEAMALADEHSLVFNYRGYDGTFLEYYGKGTRNPLWHESACEGFGDGDRVHGNPEILQEGQWVSSSDYC